MVDFGKFTKKELLEIYNNLNSFEWDNRIGMKPHGFDVLPNYSKNKWQTTKSIIIKPYFEAITSLLSKKQVLKYHHLHNLHRNIFQFYFWWFTRRKLTNI